MRTRLVPRPRKAFFGTSFSSIPSTGGTSDLSTFSNTQNLANSANTYTGFSDKLNAGGYNQQNPNAFGLKQGFNINQNAGAGLDTGPKAKGGTGGLGVGIIDAIGSAVTSITQVGQQAMLDSYNKKNPALIENRGIVTPNRNYHQWQLEEVMKGNASGGGGWFGTAIGGISAAIGTLKKDAWKDYQNKEKVRYNAETQSMRNQDLNSMYMRQVEALAKEGMKLKFQKKVKPYAKKKLIPLFKAGGSLNVIPSGKLHKENNDIAGEDKGIPVVDGEGQKLFEIERDEFILNLDSTQAVEKLVDTYNESEDSGLLVDIGAIMHVELLNNTKDNTNKYVADEA